MSTKPFSSLDALDQLSDRELARATFLIVCGLAEKLTGHVPCLVVPNERTPPRLIHGADGRIAWLPTTVSDALPKPELSQAPLQPHSSIPPLAAAE